MNVVNRNHLPKRSTAVLDKFGRFQEHCSLDGGFSLSLRPQTPAAPRTWDHVTVSYCLTLCLLLAIRYLGFLEYRQGFTFVLLVLGLKEQ